MSGSSLSSQHPCVTGPPARSRCGGDAPAIGEAFAEHAEALAPPVPGTRQAGRDPVEDREDAAGSPSRPSAAPVRRAPPRRPVVRTGCLWPRHHLCSKQGAHVGDAEALERHRDALADAPPGIGGELPERGEHGELAAGGQPAEADGPRRRRGTPRSSDRRPVRVPRQEAIELLARPDVGERLGELDVAPRPGEAGSRKEEGLPIIELLQPPPVLLDLLVMYAASALIA